MCETLRSQVTATFADHLDLLCFLMNYQCTKVTVIASFNHSILSIMAKMELTIKRYSYEQYAHEDLLSTYCSIAFRDRCCFVAWKLEPTYFCKNRVSHKKLYGFWKNCTLKINLAIGFI